MTKAREALAAKPSERIEDSMAVRISTVLPFLTEEQVALYQPLALPLALQLGGFLMLSFGFAPGIVNEPATAEEGELQTPEDVEA